MQAGDPDVIEPGHLVAHQLRGSCGLFGDRQIRRSGCGHDDGPFTDADILLTEDDEGRIAVVRRAGHLDAHCLVTGFGCTCDQQRGTARDNGFGERGDLGRCFAQAENDFGEPVADRTMMIDSSEPQILIGFGAKGVEQLLSGGIRIELAPGDSIEEILELFV